MKIAYVHILPLEYYPPAVNTIRALASRDDVELTVWSSENRKHRPPFACEKVTIRRPDFVNPSDNAVRRLIRCIQWHWSCARGLKKAQTEVIISIEPHSALAVWFYYRILGGKARLFIHHHEYYAPKDYDRPGMRVVKWGHTAEKKDLFQRAEWISQTNENRLEFLKKDIPHIAHQKFQTWPNYPPRSWRRQSVRHSQEGPLKLLYLGSASFHDTFIREAVEWVARFPTQLSLTISGFNVDESVWKWLEDKKFPNIESHPQGWDYEELPEQLRRYDIGLILYKGNTVNFVYNAPNKLFEYWAAGLEVWFPPEMKQIVEMKTQQPELPLKEIDYKALSQLSPPTVGSVAKQNFVTDYSCEYAMTSLIDQLFNE
ncbi:hypothetical protein [Cerasicoccus frondis]|uniref:hypothetical protein n=1 Tax=Cerasicoccus frondis TaxID=490090 RepID=UPI002852898D|nr:hypothetical protein [Cerasicoccus frondis]